MVEKKKQQHCNRLALQFDIGSIVPGMVMSITRIEKDAKLEAEENSQKFTIVTDESNNLLE